MASDIVGVSRPRHHEQVMRLIRPARPLVRLTVGLHQGVDLSRVTLLLLHVERLGAFDSSGPLVLILPPHKKEKEIRIYSHF